MQVRFITRNGHVTPPTCQDYILDGGCGQRFFAGTNTATGKLTNSTEYYVAHTVSGKVVSIEAKSMSMGRWASTPGKSSWDVISEAFANNPDFKLPVMQMHDAGIPDNAPKRAWSRA